LDTKAPAIRSGFFANGAKKIAPAIRSGFFANGAKKIDLKKDQTLALTTEDYSFKGDSTKILLQGRFNQDGFLLPSVGYFCHCYTARPLPFLEVCTTSLLPCAALPHQLHENNVTKQKTSS
jgi:hypothetical protein